MYKKFYSLPKRFLKILSLLPIRKLACTKPLFNIAPTRMYACLLFLLLTTTYAVSQTRVDGKPQVLSMDRGWRFHKGDIPFPEIKGHGITYSNAKAGTAWGAASPGYDDLKWQMVNLPHDWAIEGVPQKSENISQGYRARGYGWYRRQFKVDPSARGKHIELRFDGIATYATIWLNGTVVHRNWCGYTSMYIDATPFLKYGDEVNTIAIRVDAHAQEGWWYEGAGIYRHTYLVVREPVHIETDGVYANPVMVSDKKWNIPAEVTIYNAGKIAANTEVKMQLIDGQGKILTQNSQQASVKALDNTVAKLNLAVDNPRLWDIDDPFLYKIKTMVYQEGKLVDSISQTCGFRSFRFDADKGFFLNGRHVKIQGVCNHQDHAGVGVAIPDALWEFRMRRLKELGVNAYRCAHNPPSKELLHLADKLGILVMDENRNFNSSPEYVRQLQWLVRRDRNHPSVFLWSVFNEEPMQGTEVGYEMVRRMSHYVKQLDTTRPVTAAMNGGLFDPINVSQAVDVFGFNYQVWAYDRFHKENPTLPSTSSEDISAFIVRGEYKTDMAKHITNSYDEHSADWGKTHRAGWKEIDTRPWMAGGFVWTGFDYHGEPTPFNWPTNSSVFGIMDLCGFAKSPYYIHQAQWISDRPVLELIPHWSWPDSVKGKPIKVMVMTNQPQIKLYLNGKLIGTQDRDKYEMNTWMVPYQPGKLEAVTYSNGKETARKVVETTGRPVRVDLVPDRNMIAGNGEDAMPVTVRLLDARGREVPTANHPVVFSLKGAGKIIGLGNGDPNSLEPEKGNQRSLYNGLAQVIIQHNDSIQVNKITLTANVEGLKSAVVDIPVKSMQPAPYVGVVLPSMILDQWRVSTPSDTRPVVQASLAANDMNTWAPTRTGQYVKLEKGKFIQLRTDFSLHEFYATKGGYIILPYVAGTIAVFLDGKQVNVTRQNEAYAVAVPPGRQSHSLVIVLQSDKNEVGIGGVVKIKQ